MHLMLRHKVVDCESLCVSLEVGWVRSVVALEDSGDCRTVVKNYLLILAQTHKNLFYQWKANKAVNLGLYSGKELSAHLGTN